MFKLYEVDPDADTLLIVPSSSAPFAEWNEPREAHEDGKTQPANGSLPNGHHHHNGVNGVVNGLLTNGLSKVKLNGVNGAAATTSPELRIKVSSKHLSLASRHFGNKFKWGASSADQGGSAGLVQPDGRVHVRLEGVDPAAVTIVMNIIHGRGHKVPRSVGLETLAKVAVFVDRYRCYDAVEAYADRWVGQLLRQQQQQGEGGAWGDEGRPPSTALPDRYGRDLVLWIYVAYVFHQTELFKRATAVAISQSTGPIPDLGLPIRGKIIRSIDSQRQELVIQAVTIVHDALASLSSDPSSSSSSCTIGTDSFLLSSFATALSRSGVPWPLPARPLHGVGFAAVAAAVRGVEEQHARWHANAGPVVGFSYSSKVRKRKTPNSLPAAAAAGQEQPTPPSSPEPRCAERLRLTPLLHAIEAEIGGLDLESSLGYYLY